MRFPVNPKEWGRMILQYERDFQTLKEAVGQVTLTASTTSTTLTDGKITPVSKITLVPTTANAAAALATTYISAKAAGTATITHASNAQSDRTFDYIVTLG